MPRREQPHDREDRESRPTEVSARVRALVDVMPMVAVVVGDDVAACRASVKARLALYVGGMGARGRNFYNDIACRYGYEEAAKVAKQALAENKSIRDVVVERGTTTSSQMRSWPNVATKRWLVDPAD